MLNYYQVLEVRRDASEGEIRKSYRRLALCYHPDKNRTFSRELANKKFREISEAFQILSDRKNRRQYDLQLCDFGHHQFSVSDFVFRNPFHIFHKVFGMGSDDYFIQGNNSSFNFNGANQQSSARTQTSINGISTDTRIFVSNGERIIERFENGVLKSRTTKRIH